MRKFCSDNGNDGDMSTQVNSKMNASAAKTDSRGGLEDIRVAIPVAEEMMENRRGGNIHPIEVVRPPVTVVLKPVDPTPKDWSALRPKKPKLSQQTLHDLSKTLERHSNVEDVIEGGIPFVEKLAQQKIDQKKAAAEKEIARLEKGHKHVSHMKAHMEIAEFVATEKRARNTFVNEWSKIRDHAEEVMDAWVKRNEGYTPPQEESSGGLGPWYGEFFR
ncbi:hypothetical protein [Hyphomonas sp.]|uniref:hypothetical protein n=1 Tax=Hyphomonas sp. TaxID=87 RepID=UPI00329A3C40